MSWSELQTGAKNDHVRNNKDRKNVTALEWNKENVCSYELNP